MNIPCANEKTKHRDFMLLAPGCTADEEQYSLANPLCIFNYGLTSHLNELALITALCPFSATQSLSYFLFLFCVALVIYFTYIYVIVCVYLRHENIRQGKDLCLVYPNHLNRYLVHST